MKTIYFTFIFLCLSQIVEAKMVTIRGEIKNFNAEKMDEIQLFLFETKIEKFITSIELDSVGKFEFDVETWNYYRLQIYSKHYKTHIRIIRYINSNPKQIKIHLVERDKPLANFSPQNPDLIANYLENKIVENTDFSIKGFVIDRTYEPVMFANVALYRNDTLVTGVQTDTEGFYKFDSLQNGVYRIGVYYVGYAPEMIPNIEVVNSKGLMINVKMKYGIEPTLIYTPFRIPLIEQDNTTQGAIFSSWEIQRSPHKN